MWDKEQKDFPKEAMRLANTGVIAIFQFVRVYLTVTVVRFLMQRFTICIIAP